MHPDLRPFKYVAALFDGDGLYGLQEDPSERNNLVDSTGHRDAKEELGSRIVVHTERKQDTVARELAHTLKCKRWQCPQRSHKSR